MKRKASPKPRSRSRARSATARPVRATAVEALPAPPELLARMSLKPATARGPAAPLTTSEIEAALLSGEHRQTLETYFGPQEYAELVRLMREAPTKRATRNRPRVLILPGILGSLLARDNAGKLDEIWLDFLDIFRGRLGELKLPDQGKSFVATDAHPGTYLKLKRHLINEGFDADYHAFDWRQSIPDLGRALARRIAADPASEIHLVAHSMGGLVARAALHADAAQLPKVKRLIMLGTPNYGSFAPVQVYRATYRTLQMLALLDSKHSAEDLGSTIMNTLPGLMEMMPHPEKFDAVDLYDLAAWPSAGGRPDARFLPGIKAAQRLLASDPARLIMVAGVDQETTVGVRSVAGEFVFERSNAGDGTVPLEFARLPNVPTYYHSEGHGDLPKNARIQRAIADLLRTGSTDELETSWQQNRSVWKRTVAESDLKREFEAEVQPRRGVLTPADLREVTSDFLASGEAADETAPGTPVPEPALAPSAGRIRNAVVIGRRVQRRVEVRLARGSITQVRSRAYVLGAFQGVAPTGAAVAVDDLMNGTITEFRQRRMFTHGVGELVILPASWHDVRADHIVFAGLGPVDRFSAEALKTAAENVARSMVHSNIEEFATVPIGAGTGLEIDVALEALLCGFFAGLNDADKHQSFRAITFCEMDAARYDVLRTTLLQLSMSEACDGTEFTFIDLPPPPPEPLVAAPRLMLPAHQLPPCVYLHVRGVRRGALTLECSLLTSGPKATVLPGTITVEETALRAHLATIETNQFTHTALGSFGGRLADMVLPEAIAAALKKHLDHHVVIVHDAEASRIPWETLCLEGQFPALKSGVSRRYLADQLSVAKWLEKRREDDTLELLLVVNPTEDLPGAEREGARVLELFNQLPRGRLTRIQGAEATKTRLRAEFSSGKYDLLHYAGHAFFDPAQPSRSGVLCAGGEVLSGAELAELGNLPALVFFNACEAGRIRKRVVKPGRHETRTIQQRIVRNVGLAEAFLRGGVANYVGTYWPVGDAPAEVFADTFYRSLLAEKPIGAALAAGRAALDKKKFQDWADYIFYGSYDFAVKKGARS